MNNFRISAAVAALLMTAAPLAYGQTHTATPPSASAPSVPATTIQPDQIRASKMIGSSVYDLHNRNIGSVKDLILDKDGRVATVVVDVGAFLGMGGKSVAIQLSDIKADNNRLTLDMTKEQLQQAKAYRLENEDTGAGTSTSPVGGGHLGAGGDTPTRR